MVSPERLREAERRRRLDKMKDAPVCDFVELTPEQEARRTAWLEKLRRRTDDQASDPAPADQPDAWKSNTVTIDVPMARAGRYYREFTNQLMLAAADILQWMEDTGRGLNNDGFVYELAKSADLEIKTGADFAELSGWVPKARAMAEEYRARAKARNGQYQMF